MSPKHNLETTHTLLNTPANGIRVASLSAKSNSTVEHQPKHSVEFSASNETIHIVKGNPTVQETAVIAALFTVLAARHEYLTRTDDRWPDPQPDAGMRGPFGTYLSFRTNLRWW